MLAARSRRRTHSQFDSSLRRTVRKVEGRIKFLLANPLGSILNPRKTNTPIPLSQVSSIFIIRHDALGDAVLTTPLWRYLQRHAPHIKIGVAGSDRSRIIFSNDPDIDEIYSFSKAPSIGLLKELLRARKTRWDVIVNLNYHDKTRGAIFAKIISPKGISATGIHGNSDKYERLYSVVAFRPSVEHPVPMVRQNAMVLKAAVDLPEDLYDELPSLPHYPKIENTYHQEISDILLRSGKKDYIIINSDASQLYREWGIDNCIALAELIAERYPERHVFLTSAPERAHVVLSKLPEGNSISYLRTPSILHLAVALRGAVAAVSPDTSIVHFAGAVRTPILGLYLEENEFPPIGSPSKVLLPEKGKLPSSIPVQTVFQALVELLGMTSDNEESSGSAVRRPTVIL